MCECRFNILHIQSILRPCTCIQAICAPTLKAVRILFTQWVRERHVSRARSHEPIIYGVGICEPIIHVVGISRKFVHPVVMHTIYIVEVYKCDWIRLIYRDSIARNVLLVLGLVYKPQIRELSFQCVVSLWSNLLGFKRQVDLGVSSL